MNTKACPYCGELLSEDAAFCPACFNRLIETEPTDLPKPTRNIKRRLFRLMPAVLSFALVAAAIGVYVTWLKPAVPAIRLPVEAASSPSEVYEFLEQNGIHPTPDGNYVTDEGTVIPSEEVYFNQKGDIVAGSKVFTPSKPLVSIPSSSEWVSMLTVSKTFASSLPSGSDATSAEPVPSQPESSLPVSSIPSSNAESTVPVSQISSLSPSVVPPDSSATPQPLPPSKPDWQTNAVTDAGLFSISDTDKNEITITKYLGADSIVMIPEIIEDKPVTTIGFSAFENNHYIEKVYVPDCITYIGSEAFKDCVNLNEIRLSNHISTNETRTFSGCRQITSFTIPDSVTTIWNSPFEGTSIGYIKIPGSVTALNATFSHTSLKLSCIDVAADNPVFFSENGVLFEKISSGVELVKYPPAKTDLTEYTVPARVTDMSNCAFSENKALTKVTLSPSLIIIRSSVFANCTNLKEVKTYPGLYQIGYTAFENCTALKELVIYSACYSISSDAFKGCSLTLAVEKDSPAYAFAKTYHIPVRILS